LPPPGRTQVIARLGADVFCRSHKSQPDGGLRHSWCFGASSGQTRCHARRSGRVTVNVDPSPMRLRTVTSP
jgi:hypothetical protein